MVDLEPNVIDESPLDTPRRETDNSQMNPSAQGEYTNTTADTMQSTDESTQPQSTPSNGKNSSAPTALEEEAVRRPQGCLKSVDNPRTVKRQRRIKNGEPLLVSFDERVVVHTVPYWDPCGETFYDTDPNEKQRGPNCCVVL